MKPSEVGFIVAIIILSIFFLYPFYVLFLIAFEPVRYTFGSLYPSQIPLGFTLSNVRSALTSLSLIGPLERSFYVAMIVAVLALLFGISAGYGLSRISPKIANTIVVLLFFSNMMPGIVVAIPIASEFLKFGLYDNFMGIALAQELVVLPLSVFIMLGAFRSVPRELFLQARVDGAGIFASLARVILPLVIPGLIVTFLLSWMTSWDEFTYAVIISPGAPTYPVKLYDYVSRALPFQASAFALIVTIPVLVIAAFLQRYLKGQYLTGGLVG
ncbi:sugar ABC transporter permease [Thermogymnomonas acidicola]|uniref:Sugar ABC transporter permease n=1 Tax=Thermogymnomonas acidicola TaxID=399579 RepID=A0AA37F973_9ARCH|nr:carbohydrate ABC transporter permease [Thermogymnomonas acidicola]GGM70344.1 sugar ABC transporter permease [Thermogymnomonas acidicola]